MARTLADIALDGAESLGADYFSPEDVQAATEYFDRALSTV